MAQKSLKQLAARNASTLNRTHILTLTIHLLYLTLRFLLFPQRSLLKYLLLSFPGLVIEFWFERIGRPSYNNNNPSTSGSAGAVIRSSGEDLSAQGLTEWMWDLLYWTWGCIVLVSLLGDWAWWFWGVVPIYSVWAAWATYRGVRSGMGGLMGGGDGAGGEGGGGGESKSKRQAKMEKRGGAGAQKVGFR